MCRSTPAVENTPSEIATLESFAEILRAGGSDVQIVHEIQGIKFSKNVWYAPTSHFRDYWPTIFVGTPYSAVAQH